MDTKGGLRKFIMYVTRRGLISRRYKPTDNIVKDAPIRTVMKGAKKGPTNKVIRSISI